MSQYNSTTIDALDRLYRAISALEIVYEETAPQFPPAAEVHMDDLTTLIEETMGKLNRAKEALEGERV